MTIIQMEYFITVCQYMSLTKAAQSLHISQPALSYVIKQIENECGVMLFNHRANSITITDEGIVLQQEIEPLLRHYRRLEKRITESRFDRNYVRIGLSTLRGNRVMSEIAGAFREKNPDIQLIITEGSTKQHYDDLQTDKIDLAVTSRPVGMNEEDFLKSKEYGSIFLRNAQMMFVVSAQNPLAEKEEISWEEIIREPLILMDDTFNVTKYIEANMKGAGYELPSNAYYTSQVYTMLQFIEKNVAAGFLPLEMLTDNPRVKGLVYPNSRPHGIYLVYRKDHHMYHSTKLFLDTVKEMFGLKKPAGAARKNSLR